jgi:hypothetical protein
VGSVDDNAGGDDVSEYGDNSHVSWLQDRLAARPSRHQAYDDDTSSFVEPLPVTDPLEQ